MSECDDDFDPSHLKYQINLVQVQGLLWPFKKNKIFITFIVQRCIIIIFILHFKREGKGAEF